MLTLLVPRGGGSLGTRATLRLSETPLYLDILKCVMMTIPITWEQLPLLTVLESAIRTANLGSSIHTFFCGLELPPLAVLWSLHRTANLGSSNGTFRP